MNFFTSLRQKACYLAIAIMMTSSIVIGIKGLNLGLEFSGGYLVEFSTSTSIPQQYMDEAIIAIGFDDARVNASENNRRWTLRFQESTSEGFSSAEINVLSNTLNTKVMLLDFVYIGSQVGERMLEQGGLALLVACLAVLLYLAMRFEWRLGLGALVALLHDILLVLGIFAWFELSFDLATMAALLAIIGYSLNDSIVIADRIRELLGIRSDSTINEIINVAIKSTFTRTLVTSGTTLVTIGAIWILGGKPLHGFSIALFTGVIVGSLSSITLAASLPVWFGLRKDYYLMRKEEIHSL